MVSTHSRPKAAGRLTRLGRVAVQFQHTAARRRLADVFAYNKWHVAFQHTAARRRLGLSILFK